MCFLLLLPHRKLLEISCLYIPITNKSFLSPPSPIQLPYPTTPLKLCLPKSTMTSRLSNPLATLVYILLDSSIANPLPEISTHLLRCHSGQNRINIAGLRWLSFKGACKAGPWLKLGNSIQECCHCSLADNDDSLCLVCINIVFYAEHLLSFWE